MMAMFWSWILKDSFEVQDKKKKVVVLCTRPPQNVKNLACSRRSRAVSAKKYEKKRAGRAKLSFCQSKPIAL